MIQFITALILVCSASPTFAATSNDPADVRVLKEQLKRVTAEADLLWRYIGSGIDNPDIATLERAARLLDQRRAARRR